MVKSDNESPSKVPPDWKDKRKRQREANRARNRLLSVQLDADFFLKPLLRNAKAKSSIMKSWPLVANLRCGAWYTGPLTKASCHFKSTDGHVGTWNFSLKRLNLPVVSYASKSGGCWIIDASHTKILPDSLSKTIPIWAAVLNRTVARFRKERGLPLDEASNNWDECLYTPDMILPEEHVAISKILSARIDELVSSKVILQPDKLSQMMHKPLRPVWITCSSPSIEEVERLEMLSRDYLLLVCVSCNVDSLEDNVGGFTYSSGAADDEESWARGLTAEQFWKNRKAILKAGLDNEATDGVIDDIVRISAAEDEHSDNGNCCFETLGSSGISIGTRRAGRPPGCWDNFDAILNVTTTEYPDFEEGIPTGKFYLQLPVEEGKRDKRELERWMAVGVLYILHHIANSKTVLVHCAQGRDRSVAVVIAVVVLFFTVDGEGGLHLRPEASQVKELLSRLRNEQLNDCNGVPRNYKLSGLPANSVEEFLARSGRNAFLEWVSSIFSNDFRSAPVVNKETLRISLHTIQCFRPHASPSRASMQKLNRFFMSASYSEPK